MKKRLLTLALCLTLCLLTTASVFAADSSRSVEILSYEVEPGKNIYYYPAYGEITDCDDTVVNLVIPDKINGTNITSIGRRAFASNTNLRRVTTPDTIKLIDISAFANCYNLYSILIPDSVTTIKESAFSHCSNLKTIYMPDTVTFLGNNAFEHCSSLISATIPQTLTTLNDGVFSYCYNLEKISIPSSITTIGRNAFTGSGLTEIEIPGTVKTIKSSAFSSCNKLKTIEINNGTTNIEYSAFSNCERITNISLPKSLKQIESSAFDGCWRLMEIFVDVDNENYTSIDGVLLNKDQTILVRYPEGKRDTLYTIPNTVTKIERSAFSGCEYLKDIYYSGSEYQWQQISKQDYQNIVIPETTTVHCLGASVTDITLNQTELSLPINDTAQLTAIIAPDNAACKDVEWSSNNWRVSVDDNGLITANSTGTATITATTLDGKFTAECIVTVKNEETPEEPNNPSEPEEPITPELKISSDIRNGNISVTPTKPNAGQTVTINSTPDYGYKLHALIVRNSNKEELEITKISNTKYSFIMPDEPVNIYALFIETDEQPDNTYILTLDANGGYIVKASVLTQYVPWNTGYKLPIATRNNYALQGWSDGVNTYNATTDYVVNHDTRLIAIWQQNASSGGSSGGGGGSSRPATNKPDNTKPDTTQPNTVTADNINQTFADVGPGTWYAEYVAYVYNKGMMKGTDNGNFEPNAKTTRGMIVTMLYRLEGEPNVGNVNFNDVSSEQWFSNAIAWASENGVVTGYANGTFVPNGDITREQLAAILYRYAQAKGYDVSSKGNVATFSDSNKISGWASDYMQWAVGCGLMNGDNGALRPQGTATRAEVAAMLMRFCENIVK